MGVPERKFFAELGKGAAKGVASACTESDLPTPFVNFVAKLCESGEDLIDDLLLTPVMKKKFEEKMTGTGETIRRPDAMVETTELVVAEDTEVATSEEKEGAFHW